jgi:phage terminase Nu1 subunit (DNA packaging protein)
MATKERKTVELKPGSIVNSEKLAELLGCNSTKISEMVIDGLPVVDGVFGRGRRFSTTKVIEWMEERSISIKESES